jgi:hypothetical protein
LKGFSKQQQGQRSLATGGGAYQIDFSAADPSLYMPEVPFPESIDRIWGRDDVRGKSEKSIPNAQFNNFHSDVKVESLEPPNMYLGQIVPFEIQITVVGLESPEDGNMQFTAGWSTKTTMGGAFGYDARIGVLAAFVDTRDGSHRDPQRDASVIDYSWSIVNDNEIQGIFDVTGFDDGDVVVVEVWMVLQSTFPSDAATGNVHSRLIEAQTLTTKDAINTGTQTVPLKSASADAFATPSTQPRVGFDSWLDDYDPAYRPLFVASEDLDNVHLFCG